MGVVQNHLEEMMVVRPEKKNRDQVSNKEGNCGKECELAMLALCASTAREEVESSSSNSSVSLPWWRNEHNEVIATVLVCRR